MLIMKTSLAPLAWTAQKRCENCQNDTPFILMQDSLKQQVLFVPISEQYSAVHVMCPICEKREKLYANSIFSSAKKKFDVQEIMFDGRDYTLAWLKQMSDRDRAKIIKRIRKLGAVELVEYITARLR